MPSPPQQLTITRTHARSHTHAHARNARGPQVQRYSDDSFYAFTRGTTFVALTNAGSNSGTLMRTITYHPYKEGTKLCEMYARPPALAIPCPPCVCGGAFRVKLT